MNVVQEASMGRTFGSLHNGDMFRLTIDGHIHMKVPGYHFVTLENGILSSISADTPVYWVSQVTITVQK